MSKRIARLNEQLKRELSELIRTQVRDPRVGIVTITGVEVARDLGSARIFVRDMGGDAAVVETLKGLEAAAPFLRSVLGRLLHVRKVPELRFREDRSYEGAMRIDQVLLEVLPEVSNVTEAGAESDETDTGEAAADSVDQDAEAEAGNA
jgi:ribosome-binding factor A